MEQSGSGQNEATPAETKEVKVRFWYTGMGIGMSTYSAAVVPAEFMAVDEKRLLFSNKMRIPGSPKKRKKIESSETTGSMCGSYGDSTVTPTFDSESGTGLRPSVSFLSLKCDNECSQDNLQSLAALWKTTDSEYFQPYSAKIHRMEDIALKGGDYELLQKCAIDNSDSELFGSSVLLPSSRESELRTCSLETKSSQKLESIHERLLCSFVFPSSTISSRDSIRNSFHEKFNMVGSCEHGEESQSVPHSEPLDRTSASFTQGDGDGDLNGKHATESNGHSKPSYVTRGHRTVLELVELGLINEFDSHSQGEARNAGIGNADDAKNQTRSAKSTNNVQSSSSSSSSSSRDCFVQCNRSTWDSLIQQVDKSWTDDELGMCIRCSIEELREEEQSLNDRISALRQVLEQPDVVYEVESRRRLADSLKSITGKWQKFKKKEKQLAAQEQKNALKQQQLSTNSS